MKTCSKCNIEKELTEFNYRKSSSGRILNSVCKSCLAEKLSIFRLNNPKYGADKKKQYYQENKELINPKNKIHQKRWLENNAEKQKEYRSKYYLENRERLSTINKNNHYNRLKTDPLYKLKHSIRNVIRLSFKVKNVRKTSRSVEILGCSFEQFKEHLEGLFEPWMTWDNYGLYKPNTYNYGWDIDHIIPVSSGLTEEELIQLNHYTNLQPLCSKVNRDIKRDSIEWK